MLRNLLIILLLTGAGCAHVPVKGCAWSVYSDGRVEIRKSEPGCRVTVGDVKTRVRHNLTDEDLNWSPDRGGL